VCDRVFAYADFARARDELTRRLALPSYLLLLGGSGTGKTLLLRLLSVGLDRHRFQPLYIVAERLLTPTALVRLLASAVHMPTRRTHAETTKALAQLLRGRLSLQRLVVLVDEAQRLTDDALESLRLTAEAELEAPPLFSLVLAGLPELRERFDTTDLFAFKRRLAGRLELTGLRKDESRAFLERRFGSVTAARFRDDAAALVFERGRGVPALVERCAAAVLEHAGDAGSITKQLTSEALELWEGL
jgi:MSHA biogenesis protein MshM